MGYFTVTKEKFPSENSKVWWRDFSKAEKVTYGGREGGRNSPFFAPVVTSQIYRTVSENFQLVL